MRVNINELGADGLYEFYKTTTKKPVTRQLFKQIMYCYLKKGAQAVLDGQTFKLPLRMGSIRVQKKEMDYDKLLLDYGHYNKTGELSYHLNDHSDGYKGRFYWEKKACLVAGKRPYCFQAPRAQKRALAKIFKSAGGHKRYLTERY